MEITGSVADQTTGKALVNVTIWEISPDGQNANVVGFSDTNGAYDVNVENPGSDVNFVIDGYTGVSIPASQAALSDQVLLAPDGSVYAKITLSGIPSWVWVLLAALGIYFVSDGKKLKK
jgi:hypothetical protein